MVQFYLYLLNHGALVLSCSSFPCLFSSNGFLALDAGNVSAQIWVYGNSFESSLVAVVVPNQEAMEGWAKSNGQKGDFASLCKSSEAQEFVMSELTAMGKKKGVSILI